MKTAFEALRERMIDVCVELRSRINDSESYPLQERIGFYKSAGLIAEVLHYTDFPCAFCNIYISKDRGLCKTCSECLNNALIETEKDIKND